MLQPDLGMVLDVVAVTPRFRHQRFWFGRHDEELGACFLGQCSVDGVRRLLRRLMLPDPKDSPARSTQHIINCHIPHSVAINLLMPVPAGI